MFLERPVKQSLVKWGEYLEWNLLKCMKCTKFLVIAENLNHFLFTMLSGTPHFEWDCDGWYGAGD